MNNRIKNASRTMKRTFGKPGILPIVLCAIALIHIIRIEYSSLQLTPAIPLISGSVISIAFIFCLGRICESIPYTPLRTVFSGLILFLFCGMNSYRMSNGVSLDYALISDNIGLGFSFEAITVVFSVFRKFEIFTWFASVPAAAAILMVAKRKPEPRDIRPVRIPLYLAIMIAIVILPVPTRDEISYFIRGGIAYGSVRDVKVEGYPLMKGTITRSSQGKALSAGSDRPNVFLVMIESFNANFVETRYTNGEEYTPFFNSMISRGLYIEHFYGNSVQTCKGQEATLFSIIPIMSGKLFVSYPDINIEGFPAILSRHSYRTHFVQAYHNLNFDNTLNAMRKAGFAEIHSYKEFKRKEDSPHIWGWGVEDGTFYKRFFEYLDADHARHPNSPVFATLATVGTHIPCTGMPDYPDRLIRDPKNIRERYINALRLSDSQLQTLFSEIAKRDYLSNSIVILTADHSFPMREHGIYNNEICRYDESFRIPFLMIWNGKISGKRIDGRAYSQIDIGPTICDLIGIKDAPNTMQGISIFSETAHHPIQLVQPYNGIFLEAVDWPYKYVKHLRSDEEFLYDLAADKNEIINRATTDPERVKRMRSLLEPVYITQKAVEENKVRK